MRQQQPDEDGRQAHDAAAALSNAMINCYFGGSRSGNQLVKHQLDSYNDFVCKKLEQIIEGFNIIDICNTYLPAHSAYQYVVSLSLSNPVLSKPVINEKDGSTKVMQPNDARLRNMTYAAPVTVDLHVTAKTFSPDTGAYSVETKNINAVSLGRIPVMVRSRYCMLSQVGAPPDTDECRYDYGGYFIINGSEKVIISQDRIAENSTYVFLNNKASCYSHVAEIRSVQEARFGVPKTLTLKLSAKGNSYGRTIKLCMHHIKHDIPVFVMFRALGIESDHDIVRVIVQNEDPGGVLAELLTNELVGCMDDSGSVQTAAAALEYLAQHIATPHHMQMVQQQHIQQQQRLSMVQNVLRKDLLPHVGPDPLKKAVYLGYMIGRLLRCSLGLTPLDDRDSYINKRLDTPGVLLANLFRQYYGKVVKDMRMLIQKDINSGTWRTTNKLINIVNKSNVNRLIKPTVIEAGLRYGLATGNWGVKTSRVRQGVAQVLNCMTYVATLSHLRRINTPIEKTGKLVQPRKLHSTQRGIVCPSDTPEGASVGLVKNLALCVTVTIAAPSDPARAALIKLGTCVLARDAAVPVRAQCERVFGAGPSCARVFVNGDLVGTHADPQRLYSELKALKRCGALSVFTGVYRTGTQQDIAICTEGGRFVRPLLVVAEGGEQQQQPRLVLDDMPQLRGELLQGSARWHDLVLSGAVEYLDVSESNCSLIAMTRSSLLSSHTHVEVSPSAMLGVVAGSIPYSDHNQAPRNTYQSAMGKQAIGVYATNFRHRLDTMVHVLNYPQRPLVSTHTARILNCDNLPCGMNTVVAIACFTGFNQEDSVIVNRSAVDRGLLVSTFFRTFREQNNKNHSTGEEEFFCRPDPATTRNLKPANYGKLGPSGFVDENTYVEAGDVIIGKCMPQKAGHNQQAAGGSKDTSVALKSSERGFVDRNCYGNRNFTNVTGDGYSFCKVRLRQDRVPTIGDKVSCYTADHEVLTLAHGWVPVAEVDAAKGHRVASLLHDGSLAYQAPCAVQAYDHSGPLVSVNGPRVDLLVTPEHRLWVNGKALRAGELLGRWVFQCKGLGQRRQAQGGGGGSEDASQHALRILGRLIALHHLPSTRLPQWAFRLSSSCSSTLLHGMFDGLPHSSFSPALLPVLSAGLAGDVQHLALRTERYACDLHAPDQTRGRVGMLSLLPETRAPAWVTTSPSSLHEPDACTAAACPKAPASSTCAATAAPCGAATPATARRAPSACCTARRTCRSPAAAWFRRSSSTRTPSLHA